MAEMPGQPCANSFNFVGTDRHCDWTPAAHDCPAADSATDEDPDRALWLQDGARLRLYRTDTGDFSSAEIARIKTRHEHLFLDRSPAGVLDDFVSGMRRVRSDPVCGSCERRARCPRRFVVIDSPPFSVEEEWIASHVAALEGDVLDVGCGEQMYRDVLAPRLASGTIRYTGIDPDEPSLASIQTALPQGSFLLGGIEEFDAPARSYDHILSLRSLNHVADLGVAVGRMARLLRPGGRLLLVETTPFAMLREPAQVAAADRAPRAGHQHFRNLASEDVLPWLRRCGFRIRYHRPVGLDSSNEWIVLAELPVADAASPSKSRVPERRDLDAAVERVLWPLLHAKSRPAGVEVLGWDVEQGITLYVKFAGRVLLIEIEPRDDRQPCFDRTARFNICARVNFAGGEPLTVAEARFVTAIVRMVAIREHHLPIVEAQPVARAIDVREILVDRVLCREGDGFYFINPYVGCMIGCEFCYVAQRAELSWGMQGLGPMPWGKRLDVKLNAPEVLARELPGHIPGVVRMSPILTDPYQPVERKYRITRGCLEALLPHGFAPFVLTRAARCLADLDLMARFPRAALGFSIPTNIDRFRSLIEPGADPVDRRFAALEEFAKAGVVTAAVIQPMMPMDVEAMAERLAPLVKAVRIDRMHFPERSRELYREHGIEYALDPAWAAETEAELGAAFDRRGVLVDRHDDLVGLVLGG